MNRPDPPSAPARPWLLVLAALGVVFGDIGTSPLYAMRECFLETLPDGSEHLAISLSHGHIIGVLSLIIWTLILMITVQYVSLVMRADKRGEGGILALLCVAFPEKKGRWRSLTGKMMVALGIFGAALLYGDGMITPAISVLGAMEGLKVSAPGLEEYIVPATIVILIALFAVQRVGTGKVGLAFGPVMMVWFLVLAVLGVTWIIRSPAVLAAFNPAKGIALLFDRSSVALKVLSGVFLTVTGGEALYADLGHFGRKPITRAWLSIVKPALILSYLGQGAMLLNKGEEAISNPLQHMAPDWFQLPLLVLGAMAAVIASQALISAVYSLTMQAVQLGYLPRLRIRHTSHMERGQIYIPRMNFLLMCGCVGLVAAYKSSGALAAAYGIAVSLTMLTTTLLLYFAARRHWEWGRAKTMAAIAVQFVLNGVFVYANAQKFLHGGWVPVLIGVVIFTVMVTWRTGRRLLGDRLQEQALPLPVFLESIQNGATVERVTGTAVFMSGSRGLTPTALLHNLKHNRVLHERVIFMTILSEEVPYVDDPERIRLEQIAPGFWRVSGHYGFMQQPDVPGLLEACEAEGLKLDPMQTSFFLGRETVLPKGKLLSRWRGKLFGFLSRNALNAVAYYNIPPGRVVEFGIQVVM